MLVLPTHVRVQDRLGPCGFGLHEYLEHLLLLGEVGVHGDGVGDDLFAGEVVDRREVGLTEGEFELGDVGTHSFSARGRSP